MAKQSKPKQIPAEDPDEAPAKQTPAGDSDAEPDPDEIVDFYLLGGSVVHAKRSLRDKMGVRAFRTRNAALLAGKAPEEAEGVKD